MLNTKLCFLTLTRTLVFRQNGSFVAVQYLVQQLNRSVIDYRHGVHAHVQRVDDNP